MKYRMSGAKAHLGAVRYIAGDLPVEGLDEFLG